MSLGEELVEGTSTAILCRYEESKWISHYLAMARKAVCRHDAYNIFRCFPHIPGTEYGEEFADDGSTYSSSGAGIFRWLVNIRPSHLLYRCGDECILEPYTPSRFACQFGYDQFYVGNPNL